MTTRDYEAMFLLDNTRASEDFDGAAAEVDQILEKHGAELVLKEKWDERKLAYEIKGHRRATYYLVYFRAPTSAITEINGDVRLNELILRHLVMALEEPIQEHVDQRAKERESLAEESRKASLTGWGDRRKGGGGGGAPRRESRPEGETEKEGAGAPQPAERAAPASETAGSPE